MTPPYAAVLLLLAPAALAAQAPSQHECPMAGTANHREQVDHRHDQVTGVDPADAVHHFMLSADGGSIRLEAADPSRTEVRDRIRGHLQEVARAFAAGDFSMPRRIHDRVPPGAEVMKARRAAIRYAFTPTEAGGVVRISTGDPEALEAVHAFLRFQIEDHGTGDPME
jgi:hypothetical protein